MILNGERIQDLLVWDDKGSGNCYQRKNGSDSHTDGCGGVYGVMEESELTIGEDGRAYMNDRGEGCSNNDGD